MNADAQQRQPGWTIKDSLVCGVTAALTFAASFIFGAAITAALGPGMSGFVTIVITTLIVVFGAKIVDKAGALFLIGIVFSILTIPTSLFGPPGIHKIANGVVIGILYEVIVALLKRKDIGYIVASAGGSIGAIFAIFGLLQLVAPDLAPRLAAVLYWIWLPYGLLGLLGGWLGIKTFHRLKHLAPIQNLMSPG